MPDSPSKSTRSPCRTTGGGSPLPVLVSPQKVRGRRVAELSDIEIWGESDEKVIG